MPRQCAKSSSCSGCTPNTSFRSAQSRILCWTTSQPQRAWTHRALPRPKLLSCLRSLQMSSTETPIVPSQHRIFLLTQGCVRMGHCAAGPHSRCTLLPPQAGHRYHKAVWHSCCVQAKRKCQKGRSLANYLACY